MNPENLRPRKENESRDSHPWVAAFLVCGGQGAAAGWRFRAGGHPVSYNDYTGEDCECGNMKHFQVVEIGDREERREGPSCWRADCEAHQRWKATEQR